jgi:outer membrane receptor protein involved in Fe transport
VRVVGGDDEVTTDAEGRFAIVGLAAGRVTLEARRPGFVVGERREVALVAGATAEVAFVLQPAPLTAEAIAVQPSRVSLLQERPAAPFALSRREILALPQLGGDVFRALTLLPGTAGNDISAQFHVHGGRRDELLVLLDGQELYDAFHLKDFDNALSVVPASSLADLNLSTGGFPASYGDRMGGLLDMASLRPADSRSLRLSLSVLEAQVEAAGRRGEGFHWLASARRGTTDVAAGLFGHEENPSFWDLFAKGESRVSPRQSLRGNLLATGDRLDFTEATGGEVTRLDTEYDSAYLWLTHQLVLHDSLFVDAALSGSGVERLRRGFEDEEEKRFEVRDARDLEVWGVQQAWNLQASRRHFATAGFELRRFTADYDYSSFRAFDSPFVELRAEPRDGVFAFRDRFRDDYLGAYLTDRFRLFTDATLELGVRYDRHTLAGDDDLSPRAHLAWALGGAGVLRLGWGHYHQSQRAYELPVEDADTRFYPAERSDHWVAGFERLFAGTARHRVTALRAEVFRRRIEAPRPRYENLFEPFAPFPEGELDRFRFEPSEARAQGVEVFLRGRSGERTLWWINYSWAESQDVIAGRRVPRQVDQRHALNLDLDHRLGEHWHLNLAWRFHTGWPTTAVGVVASADEEGEEAFRPVLGPLNRERLPDYHRLDLRLSREYRLRSGRLTVFADVQNLYDRRNVAGFDLELDEETGELRAERETWPGFFASAGLTWEF